MTVRDRPQWYRQGHFAATRDEVCELLASHGLTERCTIIEGWFGDTLPSMSGVQLCMAHVDCDLYQSTVDCLTHLYPAVVEGGPIVFDDYSDGSGGERIAAKWKPFAISEACPGSTVSLATCVMGFVPCAGIRSSPRSRC